MNRRDALKLIPLTALAVRAEPRGLTMRMSEPPNYEPAFAEQKTFTTTTEQFYTRNHFPTPKLNGEDYVLEISGAVERPLKLSLADLKKLPAVTKPLTMECAGNGRIYLTPPAKGLLWQLGAVGTPEWGGVPLSNVLDLAGVKKTAVEAIFVGADSGALAGDNPTPGAIHFDRSIPLAKARAPETLLAYAMNGQPLTADHGFPLRAVVGGWFGMASVKWLTKIILSETSYQGYWQTLDYAYYDRRDGGLPSLTPLTAMPPKAQIARPAFDEIVPAGKESTIRGMAWAGEAKVAKVEISTDGGKTWRETKLLGEEKPFCWRLWEAAWTPSAGTHKLIARCVDDQGRGQPEKRDADRRTYMINHLIPFEIAVRN